MQCGFARLLHPVIRGDGCSSSPAACVLRKYSSMVQLGGLCRKLADTFRIFALPQA